MASSRKKRWKLIAGVIVGLPIVVFLGVLLVIGGVFGKAIPWDPTPKVDHGVVFFQGDYQEHPGHYSAATKIDMTMKVDWLRMLTLGPPSPDDPSWADYKSIQDVVPLASRAPDFKLRAKIGRAHV